MIKSLALTNFKSIGKTLIANDEEITESKLDFTPLTIFCGKNSSGKSTVLQSILLLVQTLKSNMPTQTLVLNGTLVKFGSVDDIKSMFSNSDQIMIDIDINVSKQIEKITKFSTLDENVKRILIKNINKYYYISNSINDIKNILEENLEDHFLDLDNKLGNDKWEINPNLAEDIKNAMNSHHVNFSARVWRGINNYEYEIEVHKRLKDKWYSIFFTENKFVYKKKKINGNTLKDNDNNRYYQNMNISFCKNPLNEISKIIPIISKIHINIPKICTFTALYKNKPEDIILDYNDFQFYDIFFDDATKSSLWNNNELAGLILNNFLPSEFVYVSSKTDLKARQIISNYIFDFLNVDYQFNDQFISKYKNNIYKLLTDKEYNLYLSESEINKVVNNIVIPEDIIINKDSFLPYAKKYISILESINIPEKLSKSILLKIKEHNKNIKTKLDRDNIFTHEVGTGELEHILQSSINIITEFFKNVYYIAPLREEPHLQYSNLINSIDNVGIKGENCATVLYHNKGKLIKYIDPKNIIENVKIKYCYLNDAINNWLRYIGVADKVSANFNGRYGYELKINSFNMLKNSDLTNVGVGVSQVLPIVLACLLAPEETTIIIEQPELHLHPAMQSKLTDFFVAIMLCNKQLIIETHSEYIINRLRLRAINWPIEKPINESVRIYFTENLREDYKDYKKGNTLFKPLKINEYAAMSDWPEGFFDESSKAADEIIKAASEKWEKNRDYKN